MWSRSELKEKAKIVLRVNYWQAFLVSLIILITGGSHNQGAGGAGAGGGESTFFNNQVAIVLGTIIILVIILRILIGYVLEVGGRKFFIKAAEGNSDPRYLAFGFRQNRYLDIFLTMFLRTIYLLLWTLLLIIPGIIKAYAYRMVPYILADNPKIAHNRAIALSNQMTKGEKLDIFILDLSFIGWFLLGSLALGVGVLFVQPYYDATNVELYLKLRQKALVNGLTTKEELNI